MTETNTTSVLIERSKADWDVRVRNDYHLWMGEIVNSDAEMLATGEQDLKLLLSPTDTDADDIVLEIGCGVGRLLIPAAAHFKQVIGVDISAEALQHARRLLAEAALTNVDIRLETGCELSTIENDTIDLAFAYGVMGVLPARLFVHYFMSLNRVLKSGGRARFQFYIGREQSVTETDSLAVRAYTRKRFTEMASAAGFRVTYLEEFHHPSGVISIPDQGIFASIAEIQIENKNPDTCEDTLLSLLTEQRERPESQSWCGSQLEYQLAITRAQDLALQHRFTEAKSMFLFAKQRYADADPKIDELILEIDKHLSESNSR